MTGLTKVYCIGYTSVYVLHTVSLYKLHLLCKISMAFYTCIKDCILNNKHNLHICTALTTILCGALQHPLHLLSDISRQKVKYISTKFQHLSKLSLLIIPQISISSNVFDF